MTQPSPTPNDDSEPHSDAESPHDADGSKPRRIELDMPGEIAEYERQRHRSGDETIVLLCSFGQGYQVVVFDVAPDGELLAIEEVGDSQDEARAAAMAEFWVQQHPKGILGPAADDDADAGGFAKQFLGMFEGNQ